MPTATQAADIHAYGLVLYALVKRGAQSSDFTRARFVELQQQGLSAARMVDTECARLDLVGEAHTAGRYCGSCARVLPPAEFAREVALDHREGWIALPGRCNSCCRRHDLGDPRRRS